MRMGLHFCEADTPPLHSEETTDKSEIYQDLVKSENFSEFSFPSYIPKMRMGLHFCEADTPPLQTEKTTDKSEIYQDLVKSKK